MTHKEELAYIAGWNAAMLHVGQVLGIWSRDQRQTRSFVEEEEDMTLELVRYCDRCGRRIRTTFAKIVALKGEPLWCHVCQRRYGPNDPLTNDDGKRIL